MIKIPFVLKSRFQEGRGNSLFNEFVPTFQLTGGQAVSDSLIYLDRLGLIVSFKTWKPISKN